MRPTLLPCFFLLVGCGSASLSGSSDGGSGSSDGGSGPASAPAGYGAVQLMNDQTGTELTASFNHGARALADFSTATVPAGSCLYGHSASGDPLIGAPIDIGEISTSASAAGKVDTVQPSTTSTDSVYADTTNFQTPIFSAGEMVSIDAAGNAVPGGKVSVKVPAQLTVTAPIFDTKTGLVIDSTKDLTLTWEGGIAGDRASFCIGVSTTAVPGTLTDRLCCVADAGVGTLTVPQSELAKLPHDGGYDTFILESQRVTTTHASGWDVDWFAFAHAFVSGGKVEFAGRLGGIQ